MELNWVEIVKLVIAMDDERLGFDFRIVSKAFDLINICEAKEN